MKKAYYLEDNGYTEVTSENYVLDRTQYVKQEDGTYLKATDEEIISFEVPEEEIEETDEQEEETKRSWTISHGKVALLGVLLLFICIGIVSCQINKNTKDIDTLGNTVESLSGDMSEYAEVVTVDEEGNLVVDANVTINGNVDVNGNVNVDGDITAKQGFFERIFAKKVDATEVNATIVNATEINATVVNATEVNATKVNASEVNTPDTKPGTKPSPTQRPTEAPAIGGDDTTEKPTQRPTQTPTEKPTEKPTQKPTEKPTQKPTEAPVRKLVVDGSTTVELGDTVVIRLVGISASEVKVTNSSVHSVSFSDGNCYIVPGMVGNITVKDTVTGNHVSITVIAND